MLRIHGTIRMNKSIEEHSHAQDIPYDAANGVGNASRAGIRGGPRAPSLRERWRSPSRPDTGQPGEGDPAAHAGRALAVARAPGDGAGKWRDADLHEPGADNPAGGELPAGVSTIPHRGAAGKRKDSVPTGRQ